MAEEDSNTNHLHLSFWLLISFKDRSNVNINL